MRHLASQAWASRAGLLELPPRQPVSSENVAVHVAAAELFARYGMAHDEVDRIAMTDCFCADAILEVSLAGPVFEHHAGREKIVANFLKVAGTQRDQRRHAISNVELNLLEASSAQVRAYGIVSAADSDGLRLAAACAYTAKITRESDGLWRFNRLWIGMDDYVGNAPGTEKVEEPNAQV